jgi:sialic acid synthase SpsE
VSASITGGTHDIGRGHPCLVIAEVRVNHSGDPGLAHELIDIAVAAGADAVSACRDDEVQRERAHE